MKRVIYDGGHAAVELPLPDGRTAVVAHGQQLPADVPAEFVDALLEQADWTELPPTPKATAADTKE